MRASLLILALSLSSSAEDLVTLKNGDHFTGKISGLSKGIIELTSPHSETPLSIISEELSSLTFSPKPTQDAPEHRQLVNLRNGDALPGNVSALNDQTLTLHTWFAGELEIPRNLIDSLYFEAAPQRLIYQGPDDLSKWSQDDGWRTSNNKFYASGSGSLARDFELPEDYLVSFDLTWKSTPSFRFHFGTQASTGRDNDNGYYLNLTSGGFTLERVEKIDAKPQLRSLGGPNIPANDFEDNKATVELRISRSQKVIYLYLNGDFAGQYYDPVTLAPSGGQIIFESRSSSSRQYTIENIVIREWDSMTRRLNRETHIDEETDTLATDEGDLFTGEIYRREMVDERAIYRMKIPLSKDPVPIPEDRCSVLYFLKSELSEPTESTYQVTISTNGSLSLSDLILSDADMKAKHPLLGDLTLDRRVLRDLKNRSFLSKKKSTK